MERYPFNVPPLPTTILPGAIYPSGCIIPWFAADNKRDAKRARSNPPEGWEYTGESRKVKPATEYNRSTGMKYVLYLRKV